MPLDRSPSPDDSPTPTSPDPNLQKMLTGADADGDGRLDYGELANIDPDLYIDVLGLKDAESMLRRFDKNRDGHIDAHERRELIKGLIPKLKEETIAMRESGEFVASGVLWQNRKKFMESLRESHVKDVEHSQKAFEKRYFDTVEDEETAFFRVRVEELHDALRAHWEGKDAYIERVIQQKWELFKSTKDTCKDPTAPLTPKMSKRVFELRALLTNLSRARHPTKFQLEEGERFKVELHELEDEAHARHATLQPAWYKLKERECKEELKAMRAKHAQLKRASFDRFFEYVNEARQLLGARHGAYHQRMEHAHKVGLADKVIDELWHPRPLNMQPTITSYSPRMPKHKGSGNLDRVANGLGAYQLAHHERTPKPEHILMVTASGPPKRLDRKLLTTMF